MKPFGQIAVTTLICLVAGGTLTSCATKGQHKNLEGRVTVLENAEAPAQPVSVSKVRPVPAGMKGAAMALPTGDEASSPLLIEKHVPAVVNVEAEDNYVIYVTNISDSLSIKDVVVKETLDANYTLASTEPPVATADGRVLTFALGTLAPGDTKTIKVNGAASQPATLEFCSTATFTPFICVDQLAEQPSLALRKEGPAEVVFCDEFEYKLIVTNSGTGAATNVVVTDELPAGIQTADGQPTARFEIASLGAGQSQEMVIRAKATKTGEFSNDAVAKADGLNAESNTVTTKITKPALDIEMASIDRLFVGGSFDYKINFTNTGDATSNNVAVVQSLAPCVEFVSATNGGTFADGKVTWNIGALAPGQAAEATVTVKAAAICAAESTVTIAGSCADTDSARVKTDILGIPAILLEVIDEVDPVRVGGETTYVITATNQGSADGTNITINATTENQTILEVTGDTAGTVTGAAVKFAAVPSLAPAQKATWRIRVRADQAGDVRFKVSMNSDQLTRDVEETEATNLYE